MCAPLTAGAQTVAEVAELQAKLRFLGYNLDTVNGTFGPQTRRAIEAFEFSIGMGDEGELSEGEMALLDAQVAAEAFDRFGYRLVGYWSPAPCSDADLTNGLWMDDLAWIAGPGQRFALMEVSLENPLVITTQAGEQVLNGPAFLAVNADISVQFFPLEERLVIVAGGRGFPYPLRTRLI